jgi:hypothetical protein
MRLVLPLIVATVYLLHQDVWFWRSARPLVFGVLPVGLVYHICLVLGAAGLMWLLVATVWPAHLDAETDAASTRSTRDRA